MKKILIAASLFLLAANVQAAPDPEAIFNKSCGMCHNGQIAQAPKKGDVAAWDIRMKQGMPALVKAVTDGYNAMPPRGLCMDCTAEDYEATILWMAK